MNNDDIILLAIEHTINGLKFNEDGLLRFAKLIAEQEREACAKVCEDVRDKYSSLEDPAERIAVEWCLDLIRERGQA
jgi:hypothetical protein